MLCVSLSSCCRQPSGQTVRIFLKKSTETTKFVFAVKVAAFYTGMLVVLFICSYFNKEYIEGVYEVSNLW